MPRDPVIPTRIFLRDATLDSGFFHNRSSKKYANTGLVSSLILSSNRVAGLLFPINT